MSIVRRYMGIDPGKDGGIAIIDENRLLIAYRMPLFKNEIDINMLLSIIKTYKNCTHCVLEDVHSIYRTSAASNFQFGRAVGIAETAAKTLKIILTKIQPKQWQKEMWQGINPVMVATNNKTKEGKIKYKINTKATSLLAAKNLFPNFNFVPTIRSKIPHDGMIDASLLAEYGMRKFR